MSSQSTLDEAGPRVDALASAYRLIVDLFEYPENLDREKTSREALEEVIPNIATYINGGAADLLSFIEDFKNIGIDEYTRTVELSPECPPYLGHYAFEEPKTCAGMGVSDRNDYMIELAAIYEHYGFEVSGELPDYVPAMTEFLYLSLPKRGDELRNEYLSKLLSMLPSMIQRFEEKESAYQKPLKALKALMELDLGKEVAGSS